MFRRSLRGGVSTQWQGHLPYLFPSRISDKTCSSNRTSLWSWPLFLWKFCQHCYKNNVLCRCIQYLVNICIMNQGEVLTKCNPSRRYKICCQINRGKYSLPWMSIASVSNLAACSDMSWQRELASDAMLLGRVNLWRCFFFPHKMYLLRASG